VIYDKGLFLYSHHATDPAAGSWSTAFDLVRLHRFGALDDDAKPDTPVNKLPSYPPRASWRCLTAGDHALQPGAVPTGHGGLRDATDQDPNWVGKLAISATTGAPAKPPTTCWWCWRTTPVERAHRYGYLQRSYRRHRALPWEPRSKEAGRIRWTRRRRRLRMYMERFLGFRHEKPSRTPWAGCGAQPVQSCGGLPASARMGGTRGWIRCTRLPGRRGPPIHPRGDAQGPRGRRGPGDASRIKFDT
jgi:hypothetical protein